MVLKELTSKTYLWLTAVWAKYLAAPHGTATTLLPMIVCVVFTLKFYLYRSVEILCGGGGNKPNTRRESRNLFGAWRSASRIGKNDRFQWVINRPVILMSYTFFSELALGNALSVDDNFFSEPNRYVWT